GEMSMIAPGKVTIPWSTRMIDQLVRTKDHRRMDIEIGSGHAGPAGTPRVVKVHDAKTRLSELLRDVEQGAEITISRGSLAVARPGCLSGLGLARWGSSTTSCLTRAAANCRRSSSRPGSDEVEILVDTHALIWGLTDGSRLGPAAGEVLADSDTIVWVSAASAWEIATKVRIGKMPGAAHLVVDFGEHLRRWYASALGIEPADALHAGVMDWPHRDP